MRHLILGSAYLIALAFALSGCKADKPPAITVCIGDGVGGADCRTATGTVLYLGPVELQNYWMASQEDVSRLLSWCYDTNISASALEAGLDGMGR